MPPLQTGADPVAKAAHVVRNSCFFDMAAPAAQPYDSVSLNLNKRAVRIEARDDMPLLGPGATSWVAAKFDLGAWIRSKPKSSAANRQSFWTSRK